MLTDPFELIKKIPAGMMLYGLAKEKLEDEMSFIFLIREEPKYIKKLGYSPVFEMRLGLIVQDGVAAVLIMVKINGDSDMLYDGWLNYHAAGTIDGGPLKTLAAQENIIFKFFDKNDCRRTVAIPNRLKDTLREALVEIEKCPAWTMADFDAVKNYIYDKYPSGQGLWSSIKPDN